MKKSIVLKLFLITTGLCIFILAIIFIGQTLFFKYYYEERKINDIKVNIQSFEEEFIKANNNKKLIQKLEQKFYESNKTYIKVLDSVGNLKYTDDFYLEIQLKPDQNKLLSKRIIRIPLYNFVDFEEMNRVKAILEHADHIIFSGIQRDNTIVPASISVLNSNLVLENKKLSKMLLDSTEPLPTDTLYLYLEGEIKKVQFPEDNLETYLFYTNQVLRGSIQHVQLRLIFNEDFKNLTSIQSLEYWQDDIKYNMLIKPIKDENNKKNYIMALTSLQPVDEALKMIKDYYLYITIFVLFLIVLISFYYSKSIAKPLLQINDTTEKIANLDFTETIPITTNDEIGDLSHNINTLSKTLHSYINQLRQNLEKEKKLENTRQEFIAGVSHELKTPLSIMKSCISILEDDIAKNKKDYYFKAMSKEVDKMDMLIIDMLQLAKLESGTYKMEVEVFFIDEVIEYIVDQLIVDLTSKHLHVYKQLSKIKVVANHNQIEQVITNFITNAIRYTPKNEKIFISTIIENRHVKVCVENKGAHIAAEHIEKIWDRFYRGDVSRQRSKGGTGLGLAISKNILELHNAQYGVTNTEDGVLFYFYLEISD